jgi:ABC-2 type transport system ATP-binding protein
MQLLIRDLSMTCANGVQALKQVNLSLPIGLSGLLGPHGAGKSMLLRALAGLQEPERGSIRLDDIDLLQSPDDARKSIGYLPQETIDHPRVNAEDLLNHFALLRGMVRHWERRELIDALLRQAGLWESRKLKLGDCTRGMQQRFGVAAALLGNPKLLLADEPAEGLDPVERELLLGLLRETARTRVVVLATRSAEDVTAHCARMAIIDRGEIQLETQLRAPAAAA